MTDQSVGNDFDWSNLALTYDVGRIPEEPIPDAYDSDDAEESPTQSEELPFFRVTLLPKSEMELPSYRCHVVSTTKTGRDMSNGHPVRDMVNDHMTDQADKQDPEADASDLSDDETFKEYTRNLFASIAEAQASGKPLEMNFREVRTNAAGVLEPHGPTTTESLDPDELLAAIDKAMSLPD